MHIYGFHIEIFENIFFYRIFIINTFIKLCI